MMNRNVRIAKQLVKLAKNLIALDEEGDGSGFQYIHDNDTNEQDELDRAEREGKKYILYRKEHDLWRIRACKDFSDVKKGDLGGFVESEENLSHDGECWIYPSAEVSSGAKVYGNAVVAHTARVVSDARVYDSAKVYGSALVSDGAKVHGTAEISGEGTTIEDDAEISGERTVIYDGAKISGQGTKVYDGAEISGKGTVIYAGAVVFGQGTKVYDGAKISGQGTKVYNGAEVDYNVSKGEVTK